MQQSSVPITSHNFGNGIITVSGQTVTFSIVNQGPGTVQLGSSPVQVSGTDAADFTITFLPASTLSDGQSTTFGVAFRPTKTSSENATISIVPQSGAAGVSFSATGKGVDFGVEQTSVTVNACDFGVQVQRVAGSAVTFTIVNKGSTQLTLDPIALTGPDGADWSVGTPPTSPLNAGSSTAFTLVFTPGGYDTRTASVTVSANGGNPSFPFAVTGRGTSGKFALTDGGGNPITNGATFDFQTVKGTSTNAGFTITNQTSGTDILYLVNFASASLSGGGGAFSLTPPLSSSVSKGAPQQFNISAGAQGYTGLADGTYSGTVTIQTSDANNSTITFYVTMQYQNSSF